MKHITLIIVMLLSIMQLYSEEANVWTFNGHVYKLYNEFATWDMAKNRCETLGGNLASIKSQEENSFIFSKIKDISGTVYIGASDAEREGSWVWTDGSVVSYNRWPGGQPEVNHGNNHYAAFNPAKYGNRWILPDKTDVKYGYLCKWENEELYKKTVQATSAAETPIVKEAPIAKEPVAAVKEESAPVVKKEPATVVDTEPATAATDKFAALKKKDFMYDKEALNKLEEQLDYVEMSFLTNAVLARTSASIADMQKKLSALSSAARSIQQTLIREGKTEGINVPSKATCLSDAWQKFTSQDSANMLKAWQSFSKYSSSFHYGEIKCTSLRSYKKYDSASKQEYSEWLQATTVNNIGQFRIRNDKTIQAKVSAYLMAVEALRRDIVAVSELGLFEESRNPAPAMSGVNSTGGNTNNVRPGAAAYR